MMHGGVEEITSNVEDLGMDSDEEEANEEDETESDEEMVEPLKSKVIKVTKTFMEVITSF